MRAFKCDVCENYVSNEAPGIIRADRDSRTPDIYLECCRECYDEMVKTIDFRQAARAARIKAELARKGADDGC